MKNRRLTSKLGNSTSTQETPISHHLGEWILIFLLSIISILIYYV
jgi:cytochrome c oxidase subunit IV